MDAIGDAHRMKKSHRVSGIGGDSGGGDGSGGDGGGGSDGGGERLAMSGTGIDCGAGGSEGGGGDGSGGAGGGGVGGCGKGDARTNMARRLSSLSRR